MLTLINIIKILNITAIVVMSLSLDVHAHGNIDHSEKTKSEKEKNTQNYSEELFKRVDTLYQKQGKKIFRRACFNCHSQNTSYPCYYPIPGDLPPKIAHT